MDLFNRKRIKELEERVSELYRGRHLLERKLLMLENPPLYKKGFIIQPQGFVVTDVLPCITYTAELSAWTKITYGYNFIAPSTGVVGNFTESALTDHINKNKEK